MKLYWGRLIRERRKDKCYSISTLADLAMVSDGTVKNIEKGTTNVSVANLERVLNALEYDLEVVDANIGSTNLEIVRNG